MANDVEQLGSRGARGDLLRERVPAADGVPGHLQRDPPRRGAGAFSVTAQVRHRVLRAGDGVVRRHGVVRGEGEVHQRCGPMCTLGHIL